jgi:subtilase family serine protease
MDQRSGELRLSIRDDVTDLRPIPPIKHVRLLAMAAVAAIALLVAAGSGSADPGGQVTRDHGHGAWFRRVCDTSVGQFAGCEAQVVADANGDPLAGSSPPASALGPAKLTGAYNLPGSPAAGPANPTVAIVDAYDDPNIEADLGVFDSQYNLPACTTSNGCFTKVNQTGGTSYPAQNSGWDLEIALDVETVHSICPTCNILLVEASSNSTTNLGIAENEAAQLGAVAISNSWGAGESSSQTSWDNSYFKHPGVAITASTGDSGYGVEWPASSPYVTAVGGTTLTVSGNTYVSESAWVDGGSGCSSVESQPAWQAGLGSCSTRSVADVAADADPNTGAAVYDSVPYTGSAGWFQVGGTSLSSPIIASVYALAGNTSTITDGSTPYASLGTKALHDVTNGSNGSCGSYLCNAGPGYDGPTGVGTPNGVTAFSPAPLPPPTPDFSLSASGQSGTPVAGTGGNATYTVTVTDKGGFNGPVTLGTSGSLPGGVTASFNPNATSTTSTLTLSADTTAAAGTYTVTVTGSASGVPGHSVNVTLTIAAPKPDFAISVSAQSPPSIGTSGTATYTVTITPINNPTSVSLSASSLPRRASASFSPSSASASSSWKSTLTIRASRSSNGTYTFTVTGRSGTVSHSQTVSLKIGP